MIEVVRELEAFRDDQTRHLIVKDGQHYVVSHVDAAFDHGLEETLIFEADADGNEMRYVLEHARDALDELRESGFPLPDDIEPPKGSRCVGGGPRMSVMDACAQLETFGEVGPDAMAEQWAMAMGGMNVGTLFKAMGSLLQEMSKRIDSVPPSEEATEDGRATEVHRDSAARSDES